MEQKTYCPGMSPAPNSRGDHSHFFRFRLRSCSKFFESRRQFYKFENPTPVQTPATIIDPTVIYPCFYSRNDRKDYCRNGKVTPGPGPVFHKLLTPVRKKNAESCRSRIRHSVFGAISANLPMRIGSGGLRP